MSDSQYRVRYLVTSSVDEMDGFLEFPRLFPTALRSRNPARMGWGQNLPLTTLSRKSSISVIPSCVQATTQETPLHCTFLNARTSIPWVTTGDPGIMPDTVVVDVFDMTTFRRATRDFTRWPTDALQEIDL